MEKQAIRLLVYFTENKVKKSLTKTKDERRIKSVFKEKVSIRFAGKVGGSDDNLFGHWNDKQRERKRGERAGRTLFVESNWRNVELSTWWSDKVGRYRARILKRDNVRRVAEENLFAVWPRVESRRFSYSTIICSALPERNLSVEFDSFGLTKRAICLTKSNLVRALSFTLHERNKQDPAMN